MVANERRIFYPRLQDLDGISSHGGTGMTGLSEFQPNSKIFVFLSKASKKKKYY